MLSTYRTITQDGQAELEAKKSRFICTLKRITNEIEVKEYIAEIKKTHWKANHNCYAYVLGENSEIQRSSDDGEPSGTAGIPMLDVLNKMNLINVLVVVTRYFGGIKLGTGGLIRAYAHSVSHAIDTIGLVEGRLYQEVRVTIGYDQIGKLDHFLTTQNYLIKEQTYLSDVTYQCMIEQGTMALFEEQLIDTLNGQVILALGALDFLERPIEMRL